MFTLSAPRWRGSLREESVQGLVFKVETVFAPTAGVIHPITVSE